MAKANSITTDQIDTATARLTQANGVLQLLLESGLDREDFSLSHDLIMDALWGLEELLGQARAAVDSFSEAKLAAPRELSVVQAA